MEMLKKRKIIILGCLVILFSISIYFIFELSSKDVEGSEIITKDVISTEEVKQEKKEFYVDVKGAVKKPGVYKLVEGSIVNDAILLAGGLTSSGVSTNINLSKKITDEMVIYVFKKNELTTTQTNEITCTTEVIEINNCPITNTTESTTTEKTSTTSKTKSLININKANQSELMEIPGIGESKANAIIEYRKKTPFVRIEDIKNISGIGDAAFAKIKDYITV